MPGHPVATGAKLESDGEPGPVWCPGSQLLQVSFEAEAGRGPMTWGQREGWRIMQWFGSGHAAFNIRHVLVFPQGAPLPVCVSAVRQLIEQLEVLRTLFTEHDGSAHQAVAGSGTFDVELHHLAGEPETAQDEAWQCAARLASARFRHSEELPVRLSLIGRDETVHAITVVASHVAIDGWATGLVDNFLTELLSDAASAPATAPRWQPLQQAAWEGSAAGIRRAGGAVDHWRRQLARMPDEPPRPAAHQCAEPPVQRWSLCSSRLAAASMTVAARTGTSSSAVFLTLAALAVSAIYGQQTVAIRLVASNRYTPKLQQLVAATAQDALLVAELSDVLSSDVLFSDAVRKIYQHSTVAYTNAMYDPASIDSVFRDDANARDFPLDISACFNDARLNGEWKLPAHPLASEEPVLAEGLPRHDRRFSLTLFQHGPRCEVTLLADTELLSPGEVQKFLAGLAPLLEDVTTRDLPARSVPELLGLPRRHYTVPNMVSREP